MRELIMAMAMGLALAACASAESNTAASDEDVLALLSGGRSSSVNLDRLVAEAAQYPLGSQQNPVRVSMPEGERAYLARLRCADGNAPNFERMGNGGAGAFGSIVDIYAVRCASEPRESTIWMDMYHPQHQETQAPPGFTIVAR